MQNYTVKLLDGNGNTDTVVLNNISKVDFTTVPGIYQFLTGQPVPNAVVFLCDKTRFYYMTSP